MSPVYTEYDPERDALAADHHLAMKCLRAIADETCHRVAAGRRHKCHPWAEKVCDRCQAAETVRNIDKGDD